MKIEKDNVNFCLNLLAGKWEEAKLWVHYFYFTHYNLSELVVIKNLIKIMVIVCVWGGRLGFQILYF